MTENMKAFMEALKNNKELGKKFEEISDREQADQKAHTDEYIALAKEYGIILTKEDFESAGQELSSEELEKVSGGVSEEWKFLADPEYTIFDVLKLYESLKKEEEAKQSGS